MPTTSPNCALAGASLADSAGSSLRDFGYGLARFVAANHNPAVWFWILLLIGSVLGFIQGVQAAAAGAQVCTYWKATGKLLDCDSGAYSAVIALVVGSLAVWRIYANWKRSAATESKPYREYDPSSVPNRETRRMPAQGQTWPREATYDTENKAGRVMQRPEPSMLVWPTKPSTNRIFPFKGQHHSLGLIRRDREDRYVIEDSEGLVVEDFIYASDGWSAAWRRFSQLEPGWKPDHGRPADPMRNGERGMEESVEPPGSQTRGQRLITYEMGREVGTPLGGSVRVSAVEDRIDWRTTDGGTIEPDKGSRFCRLRVSLLNRSSRDDIGLVADAFSLELSDGSRIEPVDERYGPDELQGRYSEYVEEGQRLEGWIYYELASAGTPAYALFETGWSKDTVGPVIRWDLRRSRREAAGAQYALQLQSLGGADASRIALLIERYLEHDFPPERFVALPCTIVEGVSYATAEPLRASLERAGAAVEMVELSNSV